MPKIRRSIPATLGATVLLVIVSFPHWTATARAAEATGTEPVRIEIRKSERRLDLYTGGERTASFPIGLGFAPLGTKTHQGDGATPEGLYRVCVKNPHSRYYLSLGIDYPSVADAESAHDRGEFDAATVERIRRAHDRGVCPPWDTPLGGEIFLHGRGSGDDWTLGCVALDDPAMKTLFEAVPVGTEVSIRP